MKLSEVKGERTIDVIAEIIEPIANIAQDDVARELFSRKPCPDGMEPSDFMAQRIKGAAPKLLKDHKQDVVAVMAAIEGVTPEEYTEGLNLAKLVKDLVDMVTDEALVAFLS